MIKVTRITEDKNNLLVENIHPNVYWNRFDVRYGEDWDLWRIESDFLPHYIASHLDGDLIIVSMYLRRMSPSIFRDAVKFLFGFYEAAKNIYILHSYTMCAGLETMEHAHIEFPQTVQEFDAALSRRVRYNTKWYPKKIRENFGDFQIKHWAIDDTPKEVHEKYHELKFATHGNIDSLSMAISNEVWALYIADEIAAILQISDTCGGEDLFLANITYNQKYAKWSTANVLYYAAICDCIKRGAKKMYLFKMLDYKRHFNGIGTITWTGTLPREDFICPQWIACLAKYTPNYVQKIIRRLLPNRFKRAFPDLKNNWLYLTDTDLGYENTDNHSLSPSSFFSQIFPVLGNWEHKVFADIGCGDGFVLQLVAPLFSRLIGVEYDKRIAEICRRKNISNTEIINCDATQVSNEVLDKVEVFYLYNPFHGKTFDNFISIINDSIARCPRKCLFIYANPVCRELSDKLVGFILTQEIQTEGDFKILFYVHDKIG